jgi:hypothetical protein
MDCRSWRMLSYLWTFGCETCAWEFSYSFWRIRVIRLRRTWWTRPHLVSSFGLESHCRIQVWKKLPKSAPCRVIHAHRLENRMFCGQAEIIRMCITSIVTKILFCEWRYQFVQVRPIQMNIWDRRFAVDYVSIRFVARSASHSWQFHFIISLRMRVRCWRVFVALASLTSGASNGTGHEQESFIMYYSMAEGIGLLLI